MADANVSGETLDLARKCLSQEASISVVLRDLTGIYEAGWGWGVVNF